MKWRLLITTAISGLTLTGTAIYTEAHADIRTTTTTIYSYEFPDSSPKESKSSSTVADCPIRVRGGGGGGRGGGGSGVDVNNDGVGDYSDQASARAAGHTNGRQVNNQNNPYGQRAPSTSSSSGSSGSSRVICTYFYQRGELDAATYYADMEYTRRYLKGATVRGYHFWAIPYARAMRQKPGGLLEAIIRPVTIHRARELAYKMGVEGSHPDMLGKLFRLTIEPVCTLVGCFVSEGRWEALYSREDMQAYATDYMIYRAIMKHQQSKAVALHPFTYMVTGVQATTAMRLLSA